MITTPPNPADAHSGNAPVAAAPARRRLIATRGLPASGKSTWACRQLAADTTGQLVRVNRDDLRRMLRGVPCYDQAPEAIVTIAQHALICELLFRGLSVIVDDTNLNPDHMRELQRTATAYNIQFVIEDFTDVRVEDCIARDRKRRGDRRVGEDVIRGMHDRWLAHLREST